MSIPEMLSKETWLQLNFSTHLSVSGYHMKHSFPCLICYIASKIDWNISVSKLNLYVQAVTRWFQMDVKGIKGFLHYSYNVMLVMISKGEIQTPNWVGCAK